MWDSSCIFVDSGFHPMLQVMLLNIFQSVLSSYTIQKCIGGFTQFVTIVHMTYDIFLL